MAISANTLFHFTKKNIDLVSILTRDFIPRFSLEDLNWLARTKLHHDFLEIGIPMVSFCDIPLSQVAKHVHLYGNYGIGLRKEWGIKKGITPIIYTYKYSQLSITLNKLIMKIVDMNKRGKLPTGILERHFTLLSWYVKPYQGVLKRKNKIFDDYKYYDEREWRYIPRQLPSDYRYGLSREEYLDINIRNKANLALFSGKRLVFTAKDINFIIVKKENEIQELIDTLHNPAHIEKYPKDILPIITSRILTCERIFDDI